MGLFRKSEDQKKAEAIAYINSLPDSELQKNLDMMMAWPPEKRFQLYIDLVEERIAKIKSTQKEQQAEDTKVIGIDEDSTIKCPTIHQNPTHIEKLDILKVVPRSIDSGLMAQIAGKGPFFGKAKWKEKLEKGTFFYAFVVQANEELWEPAQGDFLPAVFVASDDPRYACNVPFLTKMAEKIIMMKNDVTVAEDCKELITTLRDNESEFNFKLGPSASEGISVWCFTYKFEKQTSLPGSCLPTNRIVPFILLEPFKHQQFAELKLIDGEFYV